jgi:hypothetical protein
MLTEILMVKVTGFFYENSGKVRFLPFPALKNAKLKLKMYRNI